MFDTTRWSTHSLGLPTLVATSAGRPRGLNTRCGRLHRRAEYVHYDFGKTTYNVIIPVTASTMVDVVRGGLSYKF
jgi:hypothetical protein